jgi:hypothetical protein
MIRIMRRRLAADASNERELLIFRLQFCFVLSNERANICRQVQQLQPLLPIKRLRRGERQLVVGDLSPCNFGVDSRAVLSDYAEVYEGDHAVASKSTGAIQTKDSTGPRSSRAMSAQFGPQASHEEEVIRGELRD